VRTLFLSLILSLFFSPSIQSVQDPPPGYSFHVLENGLEVLLLENPALPMVGVNVLVKTGSVHEDLSSNGISHMLEHLLFNGTATRSQKQLYDDVDRIGGYNNANTGNSYTNFMFVVPSRHIKEAVEIQSDMLFNSTLPEDKFNKEKGIVLEEISKSLANPQQFVERNLKSILYQGSSMRLPTLGTSARVQSLTRDDVMSVYRGTYVPNNMFVSVIGGFRSKDMLGLIKRHFSAKVPSPVHRRTSGGSPQNSKTLIARAESKIRVRSYPGSKFIAHLIYPIPPLKSPVALDLLSEDLQIEVPKLRQRLGKSKTGEFDSLNLSIWDASPGFYLLASLRSDQSISDKSIKVLGKELESFKFSLSSDETDALIQQRRTSFFRNLEKPHMFGILNAGLLATKGADGLLTSLEPEVFRRGAAEINGLGVSPGSILVLHRPQQKASKVDSPEGLTTVFGKKEGFRLISRRNPMGSLLAVHFLFGHKAHFESLYGKDAAWILHDCLSQRIKELKSQEEVRNFGFLFKFNDNPYIPMDNIYLDEDFGYIRAESLHKNWETALTWLRGQLDGFVPTLEEYERAVANHSRSVKQHLDKELASEVFSKTYKEMTFELPRLAASPKLSFKNLLSFTKEYFSWTNLILSVVSPVEPKKIASLFKSHLEASTPKITPPRFIKKIKLPSDASLTQREGKGGRSYLFTGFSVPIHKDEKPALTALSILLSERVSFEIREKMGMAYGISSGVQTLGERALFYLRLGTRPENVEALRGKWRGFFEPSVLDDLDNLAFEKAVNKYLGRMMFRRLSSINQAFYLSRSLYIHSDPLHSRSFLDKMAELKLSDVQKVAQKYLKIERPTEVIVRARD